MNGAQRATLAHYQAYNVPARWFVAEPSDGGAVEAIALGDGFAWSVLISEDGDATTSEAPVGKWSLGIEV